MLTEAEILAIIDTRIWLHVDRVVLLDRATEDSQRLIAWHQAAATALRDLRDEIVSQGG